MNFTDATQNVGEEVAYVSGPGMPARPGLIQAVKQLVVVKFTDHDGGVLQVNPHCLELTGKPTLFGNTHEGML